MTKILEAYRLFHQNKLNQSQAAAALGIPRSSLQNYLTRLDQCGIAIDEIHSLPINELENKLFPAAQLPEKQSRQGRAFPDWGYISTELKRKGVTLKLLWEEYSKSHMRPLAYSQFCEHYSRFRKANNLEMRRQYPGGIHLFADYSGDKPCYIDKNTGEVIYCELLVFCWAASNFTYCEVQSSQNLENWSMGHVRAMDYFECSPRLIIPDNLKSAVSKSHLYDPDANTTYVNMCQHYDMAVIPARPGEPRDKGKVENAVLQMQRWILARLRNDQFFSMEEINTRIQELLCEFNSKPMKSYGDRSRKDLFEAIDKPAANPLPQRPWELRRWKKCKVGIDYCITLDMHHYSVPYTFTGQTVTAVISDKTVEIYHDHNRVAIHALNKDKGGYSFIEAHRPEKHRQVLSWTPERILAWARQTGPHTESYIRALMESKRYPEQGYRPALGILRMGDGMDVVLVEKASLLALERNCFRVEQYAEILKSPMIQLNIEYEDNTIILHENLHGMSTYSREV